jgi:hypothetical protein
MKNFSLSSISFLSSASPLLNGIGESQTSFAGRRYIFRYPHSIVSALFAIAPNVESPSQFHFPADRCGLFQRVTYPGQRESEADRVLQRERGADVNQLRADLHRLLDVEDPGDGVDPIQGSRDARKRAAEERATAEAARRRRACEPMRTRARAIADAKERAEAERRRERERAEFEARERERRQREEADMRLSEEERSRAEERERERQRVAAEEAERRRLEDEQRQREEEERRQRAEQERRKREEEERRLEEERRRREEEERIAAFRLAEERRLRGLARLGRKLGLEREDADLAEDSEEALTKAAQARQEYFMKMQILIVKAQKAAGDKSVGVQALRNLSDEILMNLGDVSEKRTQRQAQCKILGQRRDDKREKDGGTEIYLEK